MLRGRTSKGIGSPALLQSLPLPVLPSCSCCFPPPWPSVPQAGRAPGLCPHTPLGSHWKRLCTTHELRFERRNSRKHPRILACRKTRETRYTVDLTESHGLKPFNKRQRETEAEKSWEAEAQLWRVKGLVGAAFGVSQRTLQAWLQKKHPLLTSPKCSVGLGYQGLLLCGRWGNSLHFSQHLSATARHHLDRGSGTIPSGRYRCGGTVAHCLRKSEWTTRLGQRAASAWALAFHSQPCSTDKESNLHTCWCGLHHTRTLGLHWAFLRFCLFWELQRGSFCLRITVETVLLWPQPESEPSFAEHSLSSLCTARQGRAEMDRQSQASARAELRAPFASTIPADLGATSGLGCLPLLEAQCWKPQGQVRTCLDYCGGLAELSKVTDSWLTWPSVAYNIQLHRGNWQEASLFYFLKLYFHIMLNCILYMLLFFISY